MTRRRPPPGPPHAPNPMNYNPRAMDIVGRLAELPRDRWALELRELCGGDAPLRRQVLTLLDGLPETADSRSAATVGSTPTGAAGRRDVAPPTATTAAATATRHPRAVRPQAHIGPYRLVRALGEGGMGVVYLAEQERPVRRTVALKLIKPGMDSRRVVARFEAERQALALMSHPNVARVFDAGATPDGGRPYFVMEYVPGEPITSVCDRLRLDTRQRLELFRQACDAVQHAHQKGVIHRDLKPSNILVTAADDAGGAAAPQAKVIDFGIAKAVSDPLTDATSLTADGQVVGTPDYMSPEQAGASEQDVDTRSDVYSLGVVLYELLVGLPPLDHGVHAGGLIEVWRVIREVEPARPSARILEASSPEVEEHKGADGAAARAAARSAESPRALARRLSGDLDWVVMKALEKDRTRRYASPAELSADLGRHLRHEPVLAGPPTASYRLKKFARRHRGGLAAALALGAALVAGAGAAGWQAVRATRAERATAAEQVRTLSQKNEAERQAGAATAAASLLSNALYTASAKTDPADRPAVRVVLDAVVVGLNADPSHDPLLEGEIRSTLGAAYFSLGSVDLAIEQLTRAAGLCRGAEDHPLALRVGTELANVIKSSGKPADLERAEAMYRYLIPRQQRVLGPEDQVTLTSLYQLGLTLNDRGRPREAEPWFAQALAGYTRVSAAGGAGLPVIHVSLNLATVLRAQGRPDEAEVVLREAVRHQESKDGNEANVRVAQLALARLLAEVGRKGDAEVFYRQALFPRRMPWARESAEVRAAAMRFAELLDSTGRAEEAERLRGDLAGVH